MPPPEEALIEHAWDPRSAAGFPETGHEAA
jgi:hypothetical protein